MKLAVFSMNYHGWVPENVTASHRAAATRWGAEYIQLLDGDPGRHFWMKSTHLNKCCGEYDRVVWLDGDAIVRHDCPSLFDLVPADEFGGVPNIQPGSHGKDAVDLHVPSVIRGLAHLGMRGNKSRCTIGAYDFRRFVNGGVLVMTPALHSLVFSPPVVRADEEQAIFNMNLHLHGLKIHLLPIEYNRIGAIAWKPGPMSAYIQHLARFIGSPRSDAIRRIAMEGIDWQETVKELVTA